MITVYCYDGGVKQVKLEEIKLLKGKKYWIDVLSISKEESKKLQNIFSLHPLTIDDLLHANSRIKVEEFPEYVYMVFYAITDQKTLHEMDFVLGKNFLISSHKLHISSFDRFKGDNERIARVMRKGMDYFLMRLLDKEIDNYFPVMEKVDAQIEKIEEQVAKSPTPEMLNAILKLKRTLANIKKVGYPQRDKIAQLTKNDIKLISKETVPYFRDIYDHSIRVADMLDNYREAVSNTFDVYMSAVSNNMNEVMKMLSIIATIALPLTVISSIYGTNFHNLPGSESWAGFWVMIGVMVALSFSMLYFFRKKEWL